MGKRGGWRHSPLFHNGGNKVKKTVCSVLLAITITCIYITNAVAEESINIEEIKKSGQMQITREYRDKYGRAVRMNIIPIIPNVMNVPIISIENFNIAEECIIDVIDNGSTTVIDDGSSICYTETNGENVRKIWIPSKKNLSYESESYNDISIQIKNNKEERKKTSEVKDVKSVYKMPNEIDYDYKYLDASNLTISSLLENAENEVNSILKDMNLELELYRFGIVFDNPEYYNLQIRQKLCGIPILGSISDSTMDLNIDNSGFTIPNEWKKRKHLWGEFDFPNWELKASDGKLFIACKPLKKGTVMVEDVPLCSVDNVIKEIEKYIYSGNIRNVYALRFGYCCFQNENENIVLFPVWQIECDYLYIPKKEILEYEYVVDQPVFSRKYYRTMYINAQTGNFLDPSILKENLFNCPKVITWNDVK